MRRLILLWRTYGRTWLGGTHNRRVDRDRKEYEWLVQELISAAASFRTCVSLTSSFDTITYIFYVLARSPSSGIFWAFAMWSRYIRPGAVALGVGGSPAGVVTRAYKNSDGSVVVVYTNSGSSAQSVNTPFAGFAPKAASAWVTAAWKTFAVTSAALSGITATVSVPANVVVTMKLT